MLERLSHRERIMLIFLLFFVIIALYYFYLYQPMEENIINLKLEKESKEMKIRENLSILSNMPSVKKRYEELKHLENELEKIKINSSDEVLKVLETEAQRSGIKIISFVPREETETIEISMLANGSYLQLIHFLDGIKKLNGQLEFKTMRITKDETSNLLEIYGLFLFSNQAITGGGN